MAALLVALTLLVEACAPSTTTPSAPASSGQPAPQVGASSARPLVIIIRLEPPDLTANGLKQAQSVFTATRRLFNATLALLDDRAAPRPYLAEALPQLNTDSWQVFPDGRMETTYRLKPNATWQDGAPLTAGDFVFAWRVYTDPELGVPPTQAIKLIDEVLAPDP